MQTFFHWKCLKIHLHPHQAWFQTKFMKSKEKKVLETRGIDPRTSHMLSERSTIWATSPGWHSKPSSRIGGIEKSRSVWAVSVALGCLCCLKMHTTLDSSVGRAVDCSCKSQTSIGRWFKSGSREYFFLSFSQRKPAFELLGRQLYYQFLDSLVVRISACHVEGPGSIPGRGDKTFVPSRHNRQLFVL